MRRGGASYCLACMCRKRARDCYAGGRDRQVISYRLLARNMGGSGQRWACEDGETDRRIERDMCVLGEVFTGAGEGRDETANGCLCRRSWWRHGRVWGEVGCDRADAGSGAAAPPGVLGAARPTGSQPGPRLVGIAPAPLHCSNKRACLVANRAYFWC